MSDPEPAPHSEFTATPERRHPFAAFLAFGSSAALIGLVAVCYFIFIR